MRQDTRRRVSVRTRSAEKASKVQQLLVLLGGALALLGFLIT